MRYASGWLLLLIAGWLVYCFAVWRRSRLYRAAPSPIGWAVLWGIVLFGESLLTQAFWVPFAISLWLSHAQELVGFGVIAFALLGAHRRGQSWYNSRWEMFGVVFAALDPHLICKLR